MNRRAFLKAIGSVALLPILPRRLLAATNFRRRRPSDATWPSPAAWKQLNDAVGGNLIRLMDQCRVMSIPGSWFVIARSVSESAAGRVGDGEPR